MATIPGRVLRVLGVIRLSDETDESTSPARQRAIIANWASANGHVMAGWAEDLDVSGSLSPFDRPELGPWLAAPDRFDVIAAWKLDRLSRSVVHFAGLIDWADRNSKAIVSCTEGFDLSTVMGRVFAHIIAAFAQGELEVIRERVTDSHAKLRQDGRYAGAPWPFGYKAVPRPGGGKTLVQDPLYAAHLRQIITSVIAGTSTYEIARRLNEHRIRTWGWRRAQLSDRVLRTEGGKVDLTKARWTADVVQQIVRNPACAGYKVQRTKSEAGKYLRANDLVRDDDDNPVMGTAEPIIPAAQWRSAVAALASRAHSGERTAQSDSLQQGVIVCCSCRGIQYHHQMTKLVKGDPKTYSYYRCQSRRKGRDCADPVAISVETADAQLEDSLLSLLEGTEITRIEYDDGEDYTAQIAEARQRLDQLEDQFLTGKYTGPEALRRYERLHAKACDKVDGLLALPQRPAAARTVGTGETYGQRWSRSSRLERRAFLLEQGFKVVAAKGAHLMHCRQCEDPDVYPHSGVYPHPQHVHENVHCNMSGAHVHVEFPPSVWSVRTEGSTTIYTSAVPAGARLGSN